MPYGLLSRSCFYCPNLITVASLKLGIKIFPKVTKLLGDVTTSWGSLPNGTFWMMVTCSPYLNVPTFWMVGYIDFQTGHFPTSGRFVILLTWTSSQFAVIFLTISMSRLTNLSYYGQAMVVLLSMGKTLGRKKQSEASLFDNKFKNHIWICHKSLSMIQSAGIKNWLL